MFMINITCSDCVIANNFLRKITPQKWFFLLILLKLWMLIGVLL
jgi:hypothetical protein